MLLVLCAVADLLLFKALRQSTQLHMTVQRLQLMESSVETQRKRGEALERETAEAVHVRREISARLLEAAELLCQAGIEARVVKLNAIAPLRNDEVLAALGAEKRLLVLEDCMGSGCVGQRLTAILAQQGRMPGRLILKNLGDTIPCHGSVPQLYAQCGLDAEHVAAALKEACHEQ